MTDILHLVGYEEVQRASHTMQTAAGEMQRAVGNLEHVLHQNHQRNTESLEYLERLVIRMERIARGELKVT